MKLKKILSAILLATLASIAVDAQVNIRLWPDGCPDAIASDTYKEEIILLPNSNKERVTKVTDPTIDIYLPETASTSLLKAVVICPGGGYIRLSHNEEGHFVARELARNGIAGIVLKYRLPSSEIMQNKALGPLQDVQRAIRLVRKMAQDDPERWPIDPSKIGVMGFSAGGHLASSATTLFDYPAYDLKGDTISARPDFSILVYPVISMADSITHKGTKVSLTGNLPDSQKWEELFSTYKQVRGPSVMPNSVIPDNSTPPTFLVHCIDDKTVPYQNSLLFVEEMIAKKNKVEYHLLPSGGHGFGLGRDRDAGRWVNIMLEWLKAQ